MSRSTGILSFLLILLYMGVCAGADQSRADFTTGNERLARHHPEQAAPFYEAAVARDPLFSEAWFNLARCRYDMSRFRSAAEAFVKGYETAPSKEAQTLYYAAVSLALARDYPAAAGLLERLFREHPEKIETEWQQTLIQTYLSAGMPGKALGTAHDLARKFPEEPLRWKTLAHIQLAVGDHRQALAALTIYGFLQSLTPEETLLAGDLCLALGLPAQAMTYYRSLPESAATRDLAGKIAHASRMMHLDPEKPKSPDDPKS